MQFLQRKIYSELKSHSAQPEISLILGPRQAGKTTLMKRLQVDLETRGLKTAFFNLDLIEEKRFFKTQHTLLKEIRRRLGRTKDGIVFIDEIHRIENAGLFLKGFFDLQTKYKLIVSGSGALELKADIIEPMTGRKRVFYCLPLTFTEFAAYRLKTDFKNIKKHLQLDKYERSRLVSENLVYGGYPRVVLAESHSEKLEILTEIFSSYIERDIQAILGVEKEGAFQRLVRLLAHQVGNIINKTELSGNVGVDVRTVEKYLYLLEKTFVLSLIHPLYTNTRKEARKNPKAYFMDLGLLSLAKGIQPADQLTIEGSRFENACYLRLNELKTWEGVKFWRTKAGSEVDFILNSDQGEKIPVEVKLKAKKGTAGKNVISFIQKYQSPQAFIYTQEDTGTFEKAGVPVHLLPYHQLPNL